MIPEILLSAAIDISKTLVKRSCISVDPSLIIYVYNNYKKLIIEINI